jgi:NAD(P)-dependent dehydrogenase (short-subunit alcohol dehydrogenase family)
MSDWAGVAGKTVVITGATRGIGLAAACELARRGAQLTIVARSERRAAEAIEAIIAAGGSGTEVDALLAELSSQSSVRQLAADILTRLPRIDVLINNAGAINARRRLTADGLELTWAVNHLAPFLLTHLLLDRLKGSAPARIVTTSSMAHRGVHIPFDDVNADRGYRGIGFARYGETKLANILFTKELARRLEGSGVTANCFHPGFVASGFNKNNGWPMRVGMTLARPFARSTRKGADTLVWLVCAADMSPESGGYFANMRSKTPSPAAQDMDAARRLWDMSAEQVGLTAQEAAG